MASTRTPLSCAAPLMQAYGSVGAPPVGAPSGTPPLPENVCYAMQQWSGACGDKLVSQGGPSTQFRLDALHAEIEQLEQALANAVRECSQAQRQAADACARRRSLAWQTEVLELQVDDDERSGSADLEAELAEKQMEGTSLGHHLDADLDSLRQRIAVTVAENKELTQRCLDLERTTNFACSGHVSRALNTSTVAHAGVSWDSVFNVRSAPSRGPPPIPICGDEVLYSTLAHDLRTSCGGA